jgi:hypothetical protein
MQESPGEPTTAQTNVYMSLFIQKTSWSTSNTFLTRYSSGGTPNEPQPQGACGLQGRRIEALVLLALVLPVNARQWVLADNKPKSRNHRSGVEDKPLTNRRHWFWGYTWKPTLLISSTCTMRIAHGVTQPLDHLATEYLTCVWSSLILCTKSPTPASILVIARHVTFTTYTSRDKQTRFSTPNNSMWVSSTEMCRIQIQTRTSQLLITHINQGANHLVSQSSIYEKFKTKQ